MMDDIKKVEIYWVPASIEPHSEIEVKLLIKHRQGIILGWWLYDGFYSIPKHEDKHKLKTVQYYAQVRGPDYE